MTILILSRLLTYIFFAAFLSVHTNCFTVFELWNCSCLLLCVHLYGLHSMLLHSRKGCKVLWWVFLFVSPLTQLEDNLHQFFVAVAQSSSDGIAIRCVLLHLWMTSHFHSQWGKWVGQN